MNRTNPVVFFRNDDVRGSLDNSLITLTRLFTDMKIPISHAVEPGNISKEVAHWLNSVKSEHPDLIEIIQHGYNHNLNNPSLKMEFGGKRGYQGQFNDIVKGKEVMNTLFGERWTPVFTFPYGTYNQATLKAVDKSGFKAISSKIQFTTNARIKNQVGKSLGKDLILGKKISYHPDIHNGYSFKEISVSVNLIKKYMGESQADHYSFLEIKHQIELAKKFTNIIGVLFHHRFHAQHLGLIEEVINYFKTSGAQFSTFSGIVGNKF